MPDMTDMPTPDPTPRPTPLTLAAAGAGEELMLQRALACYRGDGNDECVALYRQLVQLAGGRGDTVAETERRFWLGAALHSGGRLLEAAGALAPALDAQRFVGNRVLRNRLMTRYLLICVDMPLPLARLEAAFDQVTQVIRTWGWEDHESRLPFAHGRLAFYRGDGPAARRWATIAMQRRHADESCYAAHTYLLLFMRACMLDGNLDALADLLESGATFDDDGFRTTQRIVLNVARAELSHRDGDLGMALEHTRLAEASAWMTQDTGYRRVALDARVRMLLAADRIDEARPILARLLRGRHAEVSHDGFDTRLLLGDYHLAEARRHLNSAAAAAIDDHWDAAHRAYAGARRVGMRIDALLECHGKRDQAEQRLRQLAALRDR